MHTDTSPNLIALSGYGMQQDTARTRPTGSSHTSSNGSILTSFAGLSRRWFSQHPFLEPVRQHTVPGDRLFRRRLRKCFLTFAPDQSPLFCGLYQGTRRFKIKSHGRFRLRVSWE